MGEISIVGVSKQFPNGSLALDDVNLRIGDEQFAVLVGPSGCGKTTLLRIIAGLEKATSGIVRIDNRDVTRLPPGDRDVAMVFQNYALYPHMTVAENIRFGLEVRKVPRKEIEQRTREAAESSASASTSTASPGSCRAASASGWRWAERSSVARLPS